MLCSHVSSLRLSERGSNRTEVPPSRDPFRKGLSVRPSWKRTRRPGTTDCLSVSLRGPSGGPLTTSTEVTECLVGITVLDTVCVGSSFFDISLKV